MQIQKVLWVVIALTTLVITIQPVNAYQPLEIAKEFFNLENWQTPPQETIQQYRARVVAIEMLKNITLSPAREIAQEMRTDFEKDLKTLEQLYPKYEWQKEATDAVRLYTEYAEQYPPVCEVFPNEELCQIEVNNVLPPYEIPKPTNTVEPCEVMPYLESCK
jgi:hypothetical protein